MILRSDNGESWYEHPMQATEEMVNETLSGSFEGLNASQTSLWSEHALLFCSLSLHFMRVDFIL